jgi:hypothetical protein
VRLIGHILCSLINKEHRIDKRYHACLGKVLHNSIPILLLLMSEFGLPVLPRRVIVLIMTQLGVRLLIRMSQIINVGVAEVHGLVRG